MNEKKFLTGIEPKKREKLLELKGKDNEQYRGIIADLKSVWKERSKVWRKDGSIEGEERPIKSWKARAYGWKDKPGFVAARVRVRRGKRKRRQTDGGRKPKKEYLYATLNKSLQVVAEERASKAFPNCEVLASYWLWEDGQYKWFEVLLVDPYNPHVKNDRDINWICEKTQRGRAERGLTPAGKKSRGLRRKGKGAEKIRPSLAAHGNRGK
ncbi:MAG: 50S ribosomal protein L15e [Candidatus Altiarchaeota archaeon]|nr:50S ribosomal protein L15e [Candidatus Altiarchaeota archaeon]